jgi:hypothetical protein
MLILLLGGSEYHPAILQLLSNSLWIRSIKSRVVSGITRKILEDDRAISLSVITCSGSDSSIAPMLFHMLLSGSDVLSRETSLEK